MISRGLGRRVEHDPRSRGFPADRATRLRTVEHAHYGPVLDQGQLGSCTGNAMAQLLNCDPYVATRGGQLLTEADAVQLYSDATRLDPYDGEYPPADTGSSGLAAAKAARNRGLIHSYRHAFGLTHTLYAIPLRPVIIGIPWLARMFDVRADGWLDVSGDVAGGHEVCLTGLDVDAAAVTVLNSWGDGWGMAGTAWLAWADLDRLLRDDGDCTTATPITASP